MQVIGCRTGEVFHGLVVACLRLRLNATLRRRWQHLDAAAALVRHVSRVHVETFVEDLSRELGGQSESMACAADEVIEWVVEEALTDSKEGLGSNDTCAKPEPSVDGTEHDAQNAEGTMLGPSTDNDDTSPQRT